MGFSNFRLTMRNVLPDTAVAFWPLTTMDLDLSTLVMESLIFSSVGNPFLSLSGNSKLSFISVELILTPDTLTLERKLFLIFGNIIPRPNASKIKNSARRRLGLGSLSQARGSCLIFEIKVDATLCAISASLPGSSLMCLGIAGRVKVMVGRESFTVLIWLVFLELMVF